MKIEYAHAYKPREVYRRISQLVPQLKERYADQCTVLKEEWNAAHNHLDFELRILTFDIEGTVELTDNAITLEGKLPLLAKPFGKKIEREIRTALDDLLA